jgi:hypothetical protein
MNQIFLMTVGFSLSGKTTIVNKILEKYKNHFFVIDSKSIHDYLNMQYEIFRDDNTVNGKMYQTRQDATDLIQLDLLRLMIEGNYPIIKDSGNHMKTERTEQFEIVKKSANNIKTVLLFVNPTNEELQKTIDDSDKALIAKGELPVWRDLFEKVQKKRMDVPTRDEADFFIEYNRHNDSEVFKNIDDILRG